MRYLASLLFGILLGIWAFFSLGTLCVVILTTVLIYIFSLNFKELSQRKIIAGICIVAIGLRFVLALFNYSFSKATAKGIDIIGDARAYSASGQYISEVITNKPTAVYDNDPAWLFSLRKVYKGHMPQGGYRVDNFAKYIGWIYSTFGYNPIAVKFINSLLSLFTGILLFFLIKDMFLVETAKISLILSLFWPSIFLWSITGLKDSLIFFLITICIYGFSKLKKYLNFSECILVLIMLILKNYIINILFLAGIFLALLHRSKFTHKHKISTNVLISLGLTLVIMKVAYIYLMLTKLYILLPLQIAFFLSLIISFLNKKKLIVLIFIFLCLVSLSPFYLIKHNINVNKYFINFIKHTIATQKGQLTAADTGYKIYPDRFYKTNYANYSNIMSLTHLEFTGSYLKGLIYALFSPFPWSIHNKITFFVYFQMIIYYLLIPFIFSGFLIALRYKWRDILPIIIFIFIIVSMYALFEGNIGTVFRHRDVLITFFLVFAAIGIGKSLGYIDTAITDSAGA